MLIIYCKQSWAWGCVCGNHCFGFILLSLNFTGMFDSYLLFTICAHRACKFKYKPPDGSGRARLVLPPDSSLKHDDDLVPFITMKTCCSCSTLQASLGQPHYFQKRHQPVFFLFVDSIWEKKWALKSTGKELCYAQWPQVCRSLFWCFLEFKSKYCFPFSYWIRVVSVPEQRYLERSLIIFTLSFYTQTSLIQFRWSKHSGPVIFVCSICTQS